MRRTRTQAVGACPLGACPTSTVLLRRTIHDHLRRARPEKILNRFQRIRLRFSRACGLVSGCTSFASSRTAMSDRLQTIGLVNVKIFLVMLATWSWDGPGRRGCPRLSCTRMCHSLSHHRRSAEGSARISRMPVPVQDGRAVPVVHKPLGVPFGYHPARAVSLSGRSESKETSIGHRHE